MAIAIPIAISGTDSAGTAFRENSRTVVINKQGAKILSAHQLSLGAEVVIENRALGLSGKAKVVWMGDRKSSNAPVEVGVQLAEAANIWNIEFPPEDWQEGHSIGVGGAKMTGAGGASAPAKVPEAARSPQVEEKRVERSPEPGAPRPAPVSATTQTGIPRLSQAPERRAPSPSPAVAAPDQSVAGLDAALARFSQRAQAAAEEEEKIFSSRLTKLGNQIGLQMQRSLQNSATEIESGMQRLFDEERGSLLNRLEASRAEADALVTRLQELEQAAQAEVEKTQRNIQDSGWQALQAATEQLGETLQKETERLRSSFREEMRHGVEEHAVAAEETRKQVSDARQLLKDELKTMGKTLAEDGRKQLASLASETVNALNKAVESGLADFHAAIEKELHEFQPKAARELESHFQKVAEKHRDGLLELLQRAADEAAQRAVAGLQAKMDQSLKESSEALSKNAASAGVFLGSIQEKAKGDLENHFRKYQESAKTATEAGEKRLAEASQAQEKAKGDLENHFRKYQESAKTATEAGEKRLAEASQAAEQSLRRSAETLNQQAQEFQRSAEALLQDLRAQVANLTKQAEENTLLVAERLKQQKESVVNEASEALRAKMAEVFASVLQPGTKKAEE